MTNQVVHLDGIGKIIFSKNSRSKNIKISVRPDKSVLVSFPFYATIKEVSRFVQKNEEWILQQQSKFEDRKLKFFEGQHIKTKLHTLTFFRGEQNTIQSENYDINIWIKDFDSDISFAFIEKIMTDLYRIEAKVLLPKRLDELAEQFGFTYNSLTIRNNKRTWGSCSSKNNINLNLQMMKLPDQLIDYILLHELVHTKIKNHSSVFWDELNRATGYQAKELANRVKQFSTYIL